MGSLFVSVQAPVIVMLLVVTRLLAADDAGQGTPSSTEKPTTDCYMQNSIQEMMRKLETVVTTKGYCSNEEPVLETPKPCIDMMSTQSVLAQLCDRLSLLDNKLSGLNTRVNLLYTPNHNSGSDDTNKPFTQIAKLKEEIKQLKRSAVFYASRRYQLANFIDDKIKSYNVSVNSGVYFDHENGVFYVPYAGVYHFSLSFQKAPEVNLEASLIVDNVVIATTSGDDRQTKIDILTELKEGQGVWSNASCNNSTPTDSEVNVTFSGFLVH